MRHDSEQEKCQVCDKHLRVNDDGRLRKHRAASGPGVCRGSGRPTSGLLDERDAKIAELTAENVELKARLAALQRACDIRDVFDELTAH